MIGTMNSKDIYMINCMKYGFEAFKDFKYCPNYNVIIALNMAKILDRRFESNMEYLYCCKLIKIVIIAYSKNKSKRTRGLDSFSNHSNPILSNNFNCERSLTHHESLSHRYQAFLEHLQPLLFGHLCGLQGIHH